MHKVTLQHSSPQIRRPTGAMLLGVCAAIVASACGGTSASATDSTDAVQAAVSQLGATSSGCTGDTRVAWLVRQGGSSPVSCNSGSWVFNIPADSTPVLVRRTEAVWTRSGRSYTRFAAGGVVDYNVAFVGGLGVAGQRDGDWHVVWQLQGQTRQRGWVPPSMSLAVRNGQLRLEGGHGHPRHRWGSCSYWWNRSLGAYRDGQRYRVRVLVRLSPNPAVSKVTVYVNGVLKVDHWSPRSREGYRAGTIYSDQPWLESRSGLYRGTQNGTPPSYRQFVAMRISRLG